MSKTVFGGRYSGEVHGMSTWPLAVGDLVFKADGSSGPWVVKKIDNEGRLYLGIPGFDGYFGTVDASEVARVA